MSKSSKPNVIHVHLNGENTYTTTLTAGDHELIADEPTSVPGGKDKGPDPYDYLLMSLGACTVMTLKMYADRKKWPLDDIYVELRHQKKHVDDCENCEDSKAILDHIEKEIIIKGDLDDKQRKRLLEIAEKCPVNRTLKSEIRISSMLG